MEWEAHAYVGDKMGILCMHMHTYGICLDHGEDTMHDVHSSMHVIRSYKM